MKKEDARMYAGLVGIDYEEAETRIVALLIAQRDRFEQAFEPDPEERKGLSRWWDEKEQEYCKHPAYYLNGAWHGWKLREKLSGNDPFMGFLLEGANEGELAAYDHGCRSCELAVWNILNGDDDGAGSVNEPWATLRKRLLELKAKVTA